MRIIFHNGCKSIINGRRRLAAVPLL